MNLRDSELQELVMRARITKTEVEMRQAEAEYVTIGADEIQQDLHEVIA